VLSETKVVTKWCSFTLLSA